MNLALNLTFVGLFVVFSALLILAILIAISSKAFSFSVSKKNKTANKADAVTIDEPLLTENYAEVETESKNTNELIAVLTAAVMASLQRVPDFKVRIKTFRRIHKNSSPWNSAGITEQINNRL